MRRCSTGCCAWRACRRGIFSTPIASDGGSDRQLLDALADAVAAYHQALPPVHGVVPPMRQIALGNVPSALSAGLPRDRGARHGATRSRRPGRAWPAGLARARRAPASSAARTAICIWAISVCGTAGRCRSTRWSSTRRWRRSTSAYDLAFLLMDLDHRVGRAAANRVLNRYVARTGDAGLVRGAAGVPVDARDGARACRGAAAATGGVAALSGRRRATTCGRRRPWWSRSAACRAAANPRWRARWRPALGARAGRAGAAQRRDPQAPAWRRAGARLPQSAYCRGGERGGVRRAGGRWRRRGRRGGHAVIADATFIDPAHRAPVEAAARDGRRALRRPVADGAAGGAGGAASPAAAAMPRMPTVAVLRAAARSDPGAGDWHGDRRTDAGHALTLALDSRARPYCDVLEMQV